MPCPCIISLQINTMLFGLGKQPFFFLMKDLMAFCEYVA